MCEHTLTTILRPGFDHCPVLRRYGLGLLANLACNSVKAKHRMVNGGACEMICRTMVNPRFADEARVHEECLTVRVLVGGVTVRVLVCSVTVRVSVRGVTVPVLVCGVAVRVLVCGLTVRVLARGVTVRVLVGGLTVRVLVGWCHRSYVIWWSYC